MFYFCEIVYDKNFFWVREKKVLSSKLLDLRVSEIGLFSVFIYGMSGEMVGLIWNFFIFRFCVIMLEVLLFAIIKCVMFFVVNCVVSWENSVFIVWLVFCVLYCCWIVVNVSVLVVVKISGVSIFFWFRIYFVSLCV